MYKSIIIDISSFGEEVLYILMSRCKLSKNV